MQSKEFSAKDNTILHHSYIAVAKMLYKTKIGIDSSNIHTSKQHNRLTFVLSEVKHSVETYSQDSSQMSVNE